MGRSLGHYLIRKTASNHHGGCQQAFCHGGAGTVKSQMGDVRIPEAEGRADALIQQVAGQHQIKIGFFQFCLFCQNVQSQLLHMFFRLFPGFLTEIGILGGVVEGMGQGAFRFLFSCNAGPGGDHRKLGQHETLVPSFVDCQSNTLLVNFL